MSTVYRIYEGRRYSPTMWAAVSEWRRVATAENVPFRITQGGFNGGAVAASAGTHDGDAVDLSVAGLTQTQVARLIELGRMVGFAAWFRTTSVAKWGTRAQGFGSYHIHAVPNGWGSPSRGAREQATAYRAGRDGLARNLADVGPGHVSTYRTRTWADYLALRDTPVLSTPPTTSGGLTMSDITTINARLDTISAQLRHVAEITGSRDALNARAAETAAAVRQELAKLDVSSAVRDALKSVDVSGVDGDKLAAAVVDRIAQKLGA